MRVYAVYSEMSNKFKLGQINKQKKENQERHSNHSDQNVKGVLMINKNDIDIVYQFHITYMSNYCTINNKQYIVIT
jgi:hypothetical protein